MLAQSEDEEHNLQHVPEVAQRPVQDKASQPALPTGEQVCLFTWNTDLRSVLPGKQLPFPISCRVPLVALCVSSVHRCRLALTRRLSG